MPGTLFVVATPIGNLEDITLRALRVLKEANLVAAEDTRRTAILLRHYEIHTRTTSFHEHNERQKLPVLLARLAAGDRVALVSDAGTPAVSDPGFRLIRSALERDVRVEAIPGPSAILAALVSSGLPTDSFVFWGFAPSRSNARTGWLKDLATEQRTSIFFESPHRLRSALSELVREIGDRPVAVARELTKKHEELVRGPIKEILKQLPAEIRGEITVVLGQSGDSDPQTTMPSDDKLFQEFGELTKTSKLSRRGCVRALATKHGVSARAVYGAIERFRKIGQ